MEGGYGVCYPLLALSVVGRELAEAFGLYACARGRDTSGFEVRRDRFKGDGVRDRLSNQQPRGRGDFSHDW